MLAATEDVTVGSIVVPSPVARAGSWSADGFGARVSIAKLHGSTGVDDGVAVHTRPVVPDQAVLESVLCLVD